jgi:hypothetical protein
MVCSVSLCRTDAKLRHGASWSFRELHDHGLPKAAIAVNSRNRLEPRSGTMRADGLCSAWREQLTNRSAHSHRFTIQIFL